MNFNGARESTNYQDGTNPTGLTYLKGQISQYLLKHGWINDAMGHPYTPGGFGGGVTPFPIGPDGRRSDIDWNSNKNIPGAPQGLMSAPQRMQNSNDQMARNMGFTSAAQATAYYQKQQQMRTGPVGDATPASSGGDSWLSQQLAKIPIHPSYLLGHVLDAWNKADGSGQ